MTSAPPSTASKLYSPALLALSVELADCPLDTAAPLQGRAKSKTCGSEVLFSGSYDGEGRLSRIGLQVTACAVGQAAAAVFAASAKGKNAGDIDAELQAVENWVAKQNDDAFLKGLEMIEPARDFPARHPAILLPWRAAKHALSSSRGGV